MTPQEIRQLYAKIVSYDNRKLSEANLLAWSEQADEGRWTLQEALDAVREHHRTSTDFLMPAHIHALIRARRSQPAPFSEVRQIEAATPAAEETKRRIMSMVGERFSMRAARRERRAQRRSADHVARIEQARDELAQLRNRRGDAS